jgi:hypothetical protein
LTADLRKAHGAGPPEEAPGDLLIQEPIPILREHRRHPDRLVHVHADEPAKQQVVVQLLYEQPLAADRVADLEQLRPEEASWGSRRPADARVLITARPPGNTCGIRLGADPYLPLNQ